MKRIVRGKYSSESFPRFSSAEYQRRRRALSSILAEESIDAVLISGSLGNVANLYYWTNYLARSQTYFVADSDLNGALFVGSYNHIPTAKEMSIVQRIEWAGPRPVETLRRELSLLLKSRKRLALIGTAPYDVISALGLDCTIVNLTRKANEIRAIKSLEEIEWLRHGARLTDRAMAALEKELKPGMTEFDIANIIERSYVGLGGETRIHYIVSTPMIEPQAYVPYQRQRLRKLRRGDVVLTELSAEYAGYAGQLHRPISVIDEPTSDYVKMFEAALSCYEDVGEALKDGASTADIVRATESLTREGYGICDALVHGFGADLMYPDIGTKDSVYENPDYVFRENMAVVIQPNPILSTRGKTIGLQLGNLCLVRKRKGALSLQKYPMKFVTIS